VPEKPASGADEGAIVSIACPDSTAARAGAERSGAAVEVLVRDMEILGRGWWAVSSW
jgi:hypothetical protein